MSQIVVNTGSPQDLSGPERYWSEGDPPLRLRRPPEMEVPTILAEHGVHPAAVTDLFLTPLGPYNTGNISLFRRANIHPLKRGWAYAVGLEDDLPRLPEVAFPYSERAHLLTHAFDRLVLLPDEANPLPGIETFFVGVHHPASMAIAINTSRGKVIFSDAFFKFANIEQMKPIGYCQDLRQCMRIYRRIAREADLLLPMYDPDVFVRYPGGVIE